MKSSGVSVVRRATAELGEWVIRPWVYWLFHSGRLFGWAPLVPFCFAVRPRQTLVALLSYVLVHRKSWWQKFLHLLLGYGASRRHTIVNDCAHLIKKDKRYLFSLHPHSVLMDGWHSIIARNSGSFACDGDGPPTIGRKIALCFAPVIQHVPVHQEMYRDLCCAADRKSIVQWWEKTTDTDPAVVPGGFSESVFANAADTSFEYSYINDRKGFVRISLEERKDIVPTYTFGATRMYNNPGWLRGARARLSQKIFVGLVVWLGKWGTAMPLTDETTTVVFPPFEVTSFEPHQIDECHAAYKKHLKKYFDLHKARYGYGSRELVFVGNDFKDDDVLARGLRRVGLMSRL